MSAGQRPTYVVRLRPEKHVDDPIRALRSCSASLKGGLVMR
jgi:hypothetical protein